VLWGRRKSDMFKELKAGDLLPDSKITVFHYFQVKVQVLQEQIELITKILHQYDLTLETRESPSRDIENLVWKELETE